MYVLLMDSFLSAWKVHKMTTSLHSVAGVFIESAKACDFMYQELLLFISSCLDSPGK